MTPESQIILDTLLAEGWREYPDYLRSRRRLFAKSFPGYTKCRCNEPKDKQVEVYWSDSTTFHNGQTIPESWTVELVGQMPDREWLRMRIEQLYTRAAIERAVSQLLHGWNHVVSITEFIPDPED